MEFTPFEVIKNLNALGYKFEGDESSSVLKGLCPNPYHNDRSIGSFVIWTDGGANKCYSCGYKADLLKFIMDYKGIGFKEALEFTGKSNSNYSKNLDFKAPKRSHLPQEQRKYTSPDFPTGRDFNPLKFDYTKQRGYTKEYVDTFGLYYCDKWSYTPVNPKTKEKEKTIWLYDYMILPVNEKLWEARDIIRSRPRAKTHYPKHSDINSTIFNEPNLDRNEPLYVTEGAGSHPKIWTHISKNSSFIFGAVLSESQYHILKEFKEIIWIPDNDKAGLELAFSIRSLFSNSFLLDIESDDKEDRYVDDIKSAIPLTPVSYLLRKHNLIYGD